MPNVALAFNGEFASSAAVAARSSQRFTYENAAARASLMNQRGLWEPIGFAVYVETRSEPLWRLVKMRPLIRP